MKNKHMHKCAEDYIKWIGSEWGKCSYIMTKCGNAAKAQNRDNMKHENARNRYNAKNVQTCGNGRYWMWATSGQNPSSLAKYSAWQITITTYIYVCIVHYHTPNKCIQWLKKLSGCFQVLDKSAYSRIYKLCNLSKIFWGIYQDPIHMFTKYHMILTGIE